MKGGMNMPKTADVYVYVGNQESRINGLPNVDRFLKNIYKKNANVNDSLKIAAWIAYHHNDIIKSKKIEEIPEFSSCQGFDKNTEFIKISFDFSKDLPLLKATVKPKTYKLSNTFRREYLKNL